MGMIISPYAYGSGSKTISNVGPISSNSNTASYTFTDAAIGTAAASRYVHLVICAGAGSTTTLASASIQGISATINTDASDDEIQISIVSAPVPTGTTGTILLAFNNTKNRCHVGVFRSTGLSSSTAYDVDFRNAGDLDKQTATGQVSTLNGGFAIGGVASDLNSSSVIWTGLSELYDTTVESTNTYSGAASTTIGSDLDITGTFANTANRMTFAFASF